MPNYRDVDVGLRLETLEAKLAERDASLAARDAELNELRAGLLGVPHRSPSVVARRVTKVFAVAGALVSAVLGAVIVIERATVERVRDVAREEVAASWSGREAITRELTRTKEQLDTCSNQIDPAKQPPPPPYALFGTHSDREAIEAALSVAAQTAEKCQIASGSRGTGRVRMIFDSLQGNVESASLDFGPLSDSAATGCILDPFRRLHVDAFKGARVTLIKEVTIR